MQLILNDSCLHHVSVALRAYPIAAAAYCEKQCCAIALEGKMSEKRNGQTKSDGKLLAQFFFSPHSVCVTLSFPSSSCVCVSIENHSFCVSF